MTTHEHILTVQEAVEEIADILIDYPEHVEELYSEYVDGGWKLNEESDSLVRPSEEQEAAKIAADLIALTGDRETAKRMIDESKEQDEEEDE